MLLVCKLVIQSWNYLFSSLIKSVDDTLKRLTDDMFTAKTHAWTIEDIEGVVNSQAALPYSRAEFMLLLVVMLMFGNIIRQS